MCSVNVAITLRVSAITESLLAFAARCIMASEGVSTTQTAEGSRISDGVRGQAISYWERCHRRGSDAWTR